MAVLLVAQRDPSALVRREAAKAFAARGGASSAGALGPLLSDSDSEVVRVAAAGLAAIPNDPRAREVLLAAYAGAAPEGRAVIAAALARIGTSLRQAVEIEARTLWGRNIAALESGRGEVRAGAAEEIGASARTDAVQRLLPLVDPNRQPDAALLVAAARGLGEAGDGAARPHLEALLTERAEVAEAAVAALGRLGDPGAVDALAAAASGGSARFASAAVEALSALPQATNVGVALCELAVQTIDPAVAARAAHQARLREAECPPKLFVGRLGRGQDAAALAALSELGPSGDAAKMAGERVLALLEGGRLDVALRPAAARTLGRLGWTGAGAAILKRAGALHQRIADARLRPLPETSPPERIGRLASADIEELGALLAAAGRLRAEGAPALLAPLAADPSPLIRAGALEGLAFAAPEDALAPLSPGLADPDPGVRMAAASGMSRLGVRAVAPLAEAAKLARTGEPQWRIELATALGDTGAAEAIPALAGLLNGPSAPAAAAAISRIGSPAGARPLLDLVAGASATARVEAIDALAQLAAPEAGPAVAVPEAGPVITAQLTSDRAEVRAAAARALGRLRYEGASERLEALRSDYYGRVRRAAVEALAKLPSGAQGRR